MWQTYWLDILRRARVGAHPGNKLERAAVRCVIRWIRTLRTERRVPSVTPEWSATMALAETIAQRG
jgi:hypothetical protein